MPLSLPSISASTANHLLNSAVMTHRSRWSVLKASGSGLREYLQGQITQDIGRLNQDQGIHCCLLTPQGRPVSELYIVAGNQDELIMLTPASHAEATVGRLRRFALGYDLRIGIVNALAICSVQGAHAHTALDLFSLDEPGESWLSVSRSSDEDSFALVMPAQPRGFWIISTPDRIDSATGNVYAVDEEEMEAMRIIRGIPDFGVEWNESVHPLNANLIEFDGVSFEKGCYVGQEVTSRMHWRGGIKKRLYRVAMDGKPDHLPAAVYSSAKIGELKSAAIDHEGNCCGIALLPIDVAESEPQLTLENDVPLTILESCHA